MIQSEKQACRQALSQPGPGSFPSDQRPHRHAKTLHHFSPPPPFRERGARRRVLIISNNMVRHGKKTAEHVVNTRPNSDVVVKATVTVVEAYPTQGAPQRTQTNTVLRGGAHQATTHFI